MRRILVMVFAIMIAGTMGMSAQNEDNPAYNEITSIQRVMIQGAEEILEAENTLDMEIVHFQVDLIMGDDWKYTYRNLSTWTYLLYAEGERLMVSDLDMNIMKQNPITEEWSEVKSDVREEFGALCVIEVNEPARYAIGLKIAKYKPGYSAGHYFLIIGHARPE